MPPWMGAVLLIKVKYPICHETVRLQAAAAAMSELAIAVRSKSVDL